MAKQKEEVKTGFENTGQEDTYGQVGKDSDLPLGATGATSVAGNMGTTGASAPAAPTGVTGSTSMPEEQGKTGATGATTITETPPDNEDELAFLKGETGATASGSTGATGATAATGSTGATGATGATTSIFDVEDLKKNIEKDKEQEEEAKKFDWIAYAKKSYDVTITENTPEALAKALNQKVEDSKQKTVVDTSKYGEEAKTLIEFLENGGTMEEVMNPVAKLDKYIQETSDDDKLLDYLIGSKKMSEKDAKAKLEEIKEDGSFEEELEKIEDNLLDFRNKSFNKALSTSAERAAARQQAIIQERETERKEMSKVVDELTDFLGMPLTPEAKEYLKVEISTGKLTEANNNARTQVFARLYDLFGNKITASYQQQISEAKRVGFNEGKQKEIDKNHHIPPPVETPGAVETKTIETGADPLAAFRNIDQDAISVD